MTCYKNGIKINKNSLYNKVIYSYCKMVLNSCLAN